eukprot:CAMPEP_0177776784 /NCGR_PEP_ID=MMETSP0491_2-20121128/14911_1 /TAXON_ID=63592 /ORGANISM="Tetraselmis chuii, Strain PLY429" /LENGTH=165 /DNA_ID=CAMNT_0019295625 /DNA_START=112 /DNA_END=606 /DNA_ORIENTATION=-
MTHPGRIWMKRKACRGRMSSLRVEGGGYTFCGGNYVKRSLQPSSATLISSRIYFTRPCVCLRDQHSFPLNHTRISGVCIVGSAALWLILWISSSANEEWYRRALWGGDVYRRRGLCKGAGSLEEELAGVVPLEQGAAPSSQTLQQQAQAVAPTWRAVLDSLPPSA